MNTISITSIGAIVLGLLAAIAVAFPVSAQVLDVGVSLDADTSVSTDTVQVDATTTTQTETTQQKKSEPFTILRSSLTAGSDTSASPKNSASVSTDEDLSAYTTAALRADENIDAVTYGDSNVEVAYYEQGRLLGLFPVTMKATAKVAADGAVAVSYPWYRFLVATDTNADVESQIQARVDAWRTGAAVDAGFTASTKAALMDEIRTALKTSATADASVR
ncbi:MAG: hypothetical protein AAB582_02115 [Patescibacteria group bacterium]